MKKKELLEFRKNTLSENRNKLEKAVSKIAELRVEFAAGNLKNPKDIKLKKIDIAQMKTMIREKEILESEKANKELLKEEKSK